MSRLLEIFGKALDVNTADLILQWLDTIHTARAETDIIAKDFDETIQLIGQGSLEAAEQKLKFHLFEHPDSMKGRMAAAAICLYRNQAKDAIATLQSVYLGQPSNTMVLYAMGYCYERLGKHAEAAEFYQDCLKFKSYLQLPRFRLAAIYFRNGQLEKTIQQYVLLTTDYPDDIWSLVTLGHLYLANQRYSLAMKAFDSAILMHPDNFYLDEYDGKIGTLVAKGRVPEAIDLVKQQIDLNGPTAELYMKLADLFGLLGQDDQAILYYDKILRLQPNSLVATIKLGTSHLKSRRHQPASQYFSRAVELNDQIVEAYLGLATAQFLGGSGQQAGQTLSLASAIQQNSTVLFAQAAALQLQSDLETDDFRPSFEPGLGAAVPPMELDSISITPGDLPPGQDTGGKIPQSDVFDSLLQRLISQHQTHLASCPENADLQCRYGLLLMSTNRTNEAITALENAITANPTYHRARCKLAICLYDTGKPELAFDYLTQLYRCTNKNTTQSIPANPLGKDILQLHYQTAILFCDRGKFARAVANLQAAIKDNFAQHDAGPNISVVLQNLGLIDRAAAASRCLRETARHGIKLGPDGQTETAEE